MNKNEIKLQKNNSNRDWSDLEWIQEFHSFLQGDIPEGISMAVPMKNGGIKSSKVIFYVILSGVTTGIGAFFGSLIGGISEATIAICLSFAAGAMVYIVSRRAYTRG